MESRNVLKSTVTAVDEAVTNENIGNFLNQTHVDELLRTALLSGKVSGQREREMSLL